MGRLRMIWVVLVGVLAVGAVVGVVAANGRARHVVHAARIPALKGSAANGGRVIVVLKQTNRSVSLAHGLAKRRAVDSVAAGADRVEHQALGRQRDPRR